MDHTDDFQFKPLTEGLGFHRNHAAPGAGNQATATTQAAAIPVNLPTMKTPTLDISDELGLTEILPRKGYEAPKTKASIPSAPFETPNTVDEILKTLSEKRNLDFAKTNELKKNLKSTTAVYKASTWDFSASLLDFMLVVSAQLFCLILLLVVTKIDLFMNLYRPDAGGQIYLSLAGLFAAITWIYLVANRTFLGFTPGEWVFDQRLGQPEQMNTASYIGKVALRSLFVIATGFVIFPLLSAITRKDLLGKMLGLELVRKV